jgi:citronellol/citronellal dehydrogenase
VSSIDPTKDNRLVDLTGRVAIVTGGGTGIGAATARLLARHGADVVIAARTVEDLEHTAQAVEGATGRRCVPVPTDVTDEKQVVSMVERAVDELGRIDILVNNAGGTRMRPLTELSTRSWDAGFNLNVRSAYLCTREAGRHLVAQRSGAIVNVSSRAGVTGVKGGAHYSSSKAALQMFTTVTAAEWGRFGIRANCVAVGLVASERAVEAWRVANIDADAIGAGTPLGRAGTPNEVANAIHFFASDAASYISGQTLSVDGGPSLGGIPDT